MASGVELATAYVTLAVEGSNVAPQTRKAFGGVEAEADRSGKSAGKRMGSGIGGGIAAAAKSFAGPIAAAFGAMAIGNFLKDSVAEARESQKVGAVTEQIIRSTGGAAKLTAGQVGDLATAISNKTGMDDEAIQSGANLLLTFKNVRNEVGKGNDVFSRATAAAADLSAAGFGSVENSSKMLGKALNDPLKGISALGRAGVTFTDQQKKQIETLVKSGKTLEAQKIIMGEVESQVGGVAAASATMGEKVGVAFGNFKEKIGTALLPILDKFGNWFLEKGLPALERFGKWFTEKGVPALQKIGDKVGEFVGWLRDDLWPAIQKGYQEVLPAIKSALDTVTGGLGDSGSSFKDLGKIVTEKVIPVLSFIIKNVLPVVAANLRTLIEAVKFTHRAFTTLASIAIKAFSTVLGAIISVAKGFQNMLYALSRVPGFGWAKTAADKMGGPIAKLHAIKNGIDAIPNSKSVTIAVSTKLLGPGRINVGGKQVNVGMRAGGGPVAANTPYWVGDNPDGSLNRTSELFVPDRSGTIFNQSQLARSSAPAAAEPAGSGMPRVIQLVLQDGRVLTELVMDSMGNVLSGGRTTVLT